MEFRLVQKAELTRPAALPKEATADVTFRRLQRFKVTPKKTYGWRLKRGGILMASGEVTPDEAGLLTISRLPITIIPGRLTLAPMRK